MEEKMSGRIENKLYFQEVEGPSPAVSPEQSAKRPEKETENKKRQRELRRWLKLKKP